MRDRYTELQQYDVELADIGKDAAYRVRISRHARPSDDDQPDLDANRARL